MIVIDPYIHIGLQARLVASGVFTLSLKVTLSGPEAWSCYQRGVYTAFLSAPLMCTEGIPEDICWDEASTSQRCDRAKTNVNIRCYVTVVARVMETYNYREPAKQKR